MLFYQTGWLYDYVINSAFKVLIQTTWQAVSLFIIFVGLLGLFFKLYNFIIQSFVRPGARFSLQRVLIYFVGISFGVGYATFSTINQPVIANSYLNTPVEMTGEVVGLPVTSNSQFGGKVSFRFKVFTVKILKNPSQNPLRYTEKHPLLKLNWYATKNSVVPTIKPGQKWSLSVKLKPNHGLLNPGGFDYEQTLFTQGIQASGYVLRKRPITLLQDSTGGVRYQLQQYLNKLFAGSEFKGLYLALLLGDKSDITSKQWQTLQQTGTIHLMAISGLHVGIIAFISFGIFSWLWKGLIRLPNHGKWLGSFVSFIQTVPKIKFASLGVMVISLGYLFISGASIPTQRAWIMLMVLLAFISLDRKFQPLSALALAMLLVVLWLPSSVMKIGFWLSFMAVFLIFTILQFSWVKPLSNVKKTLLVQVALTFGLLPLLAFYFNQIPVVSFFANMIAVPFVSFLGLPLLLFTFVMSVFEPLPWVGSFIVESLVFLNDLFWGWLWFIFEQLLTFSHSWFGVSNQGYWLVGSITWWQVSLFYLAVWIVMKWELFKNKSVSVPCIILKLFLVLAMAILILWGGNALNKTEIPNNQVLLTLLDVGQGQAVVIETKNHVVLYDAGPKWNDRLDGASLAILPYLKHKGLKQIDTLIVSHTDSDHAGGAQRLLDNLPVKVALSGQANKQNKLIKTNVFKSCHQQHWQFDGVKFQVISSSALLSTSPVKARAKVNDNDQSCVLKIVIGDKAILITGDASSKIEKQLIEQYPNLQADILIAGHHGSQTATSSAWLSAVSPQWVLFSTGFQNRYHFPSKQVVQRVEKAHSKWLNTACSGAIQFTMSAKQVNLGGQTRLDHPRIYHHQCRRPLYNAKSD